jgi:hypothetical protein
MTTPPRARSIDDWLREGRDIIDEALARVDARVSNAAPVSDERVLSVVELCKELVKVGEAR